jgi:hypothetical protein
MLLSSLRLPVTAAALLFLTASASSAQGVKLEFLNGTVNLSAENVQVRAILTEWARLGGTTIVGGDQVTGAPVSLVLTGVPERAALDIVLREVPGYMLAARADVTKGASRFDRIMVVATTATPRPAAGTTFSSAPAAFVPNDQDQLANERAEEAQRVREEAQRARDEAMRRAAEAARGIVTPGVVTRDAPPAFAAPEPRPLPPAGPTPANPFAPTPGSATPGTIAPVPQQQQPQSGPRPVQ